MHIISNIALISINETMVVQLVSFLLFMFLMNRWMFKPLRRTMFERETYLDNLRRDIKKAEVSEKRLETEMRSLQEAVKKEAFSATQAIESGGAREASAIFDEAKRRIALLKEKAKADVAAQIAEARKSLESESEGLTVKIMERVLDRGIGS